MRAEANTNSANCAHDRRDYSCAVLGLVVDVPVIVQRQVRSSRSSRSSTSLSWCRGSFPWCSPKTTEILQLQSVDKVSMSLLCKSSKFSSADGEETVELPQLQLVAAGHCRSHARRCATTDACGSDVRKL